MRTRWVLVLGLAAAAAWWGARPAPPPAARGASVVEALSSSGDTAGFARADRVRAFSFPRDAGPHPEFQTEWWYYTGVLHAPDRVFGYQLTFFRRALAARVPRRSTPFAARDVYFAHFALSDVRAERFHAFERWSRGAAGLAGASAARVWLDDWRALRDHPPLENILTRDAITNRDRTVRGNILKRGAITTLRAREADVAIELELRARKPIVLQGDRGWSRKSSEPGNASYYYSQPRMETRGTVTVGGAAYEVQGNSWGDREWSTSALSRGVAGWDWFALHLSDGRDVMLYRLRRKAGAADPFSSGTLIARDGSPRTLASTDFSTEERAHWTSPRSRGTYPARWRLRIPSAGLVLDVEPLLADQELLLTFTYWEGAARCRGHGVTGEGYVELTGYAPSGREGAAP